MQTKINYSIISKLYKGNENAFQSFFHSSSAKVKMFDY